MWDRSEKNFTYITLPPRHNTIYTYHLWINFNTLFIEMKGWIFFCEILIDLFGFPFFHYDNQCRRMLLLLLHNYMRSGFYREHFSTSWRFMRLQFCICFILCYTAFTEDRTQDLTLTRRALYHWAIKAYYYLFTYI